MDFVLSFFDRNMTLPLEDLLHRCSAGDFESQIKNQVMIYLVKAKFVVKMIQNLPNFDPKDILLFQNKKELKRLRETVTFLELGSREDCEKHYKKAGAKMHRFFSAMIKQHASQPDYARCLELIADKDYLDKAIAPGKLVELKAKLDSNSTVSMINLMTPLKYVWNLFDSKKSETVELQLCFPDPEFLYLYYKLIDSRATLFLLRVYAKSVRQSQKLYLPLDVFEKEFVESRSYTQTRVRSLRDKGFLGSVAPEFLIQREFLSEKQMKRASRGGLVAQFRESLAEYAVFDSNRAEGKSRLTPGKLEILKSAPAFKSGPMSSELIPSLGEPRRSAKAAHSNQSLFRFLSISMLSSREIDLKKLVHEKVRLKNVHRVLIHFHGGGFTCMSPDSHKVYLRKYCNQLDALIFSVDYPLAPQVKFPELIENCIKAYLYIFLLLKKVLKLKRPKIVLAGDSAGGNICLAVLNWLLMNKLPVPQAAQLCYPVCSLDDSVFSPSQVHLFQDFIFSVFKLKMCRDCYLDEASDPKRDFMLR